MTRRPDAAAHTEPAAVESDVRSHPLLSGDVHDSDRYPPQRSSIGQKIAHQIASSAARANTTTSVCLTLAERYCHHQQCSGVHLWSSCRARPLRRTPVGARARHPYPADRPAATTVLTSSTGSAPRGVARLDRLEPSATCSRDRERPALTPPRTATAEAPRRHRVCLLSRIFVYSLQ